MGIGIGVLLERARIFVGLDLGQSQDPSALPVVERAEVFPGEMDWVTYERRRPVLDMMRAANLGCEIVPVLLTGRGAGVLRQRSLARAEMRPDYGPASDAR